jgi:uncharacterized protein YbaR (Trm112 family)
MKPWLLNILACPIDKHHPLEAYFYRWETTLEEMDKINRDAGEPNTHFRKQYGHLAKQIEDGTISPASIREIRDETEMTPAQELLGETRRFLNRLEYVDTPEAAALLREFPEGVDVLYRYMNLVEVAEGLLRCPECGRWYPIGNAVETIPELMPDDLREREKELDWLRKWSEKLPEKVISEGRPFTL